LSKAITYYAILDDEATRNNPAGIVRRIEDSDGSFADEGLHRDGAWNRTSLIVEWERGESTDDLVEVPEDEANQIIDRFRSRWSTPG
jgi:hypothetical protein